MTKKIFNFLYVFLIIIFVVSFFQLKKLPTRDKLVKEIMNEPIQATSTVLKDFDFEYRGIDYNVKPVADYELWGLVVTVNDIKKWYNVYHDKNSVNVKDVCVIWGDNLRSDAYQDVHYKSGEWTCYFRWYGQLDGHFYQNKLSNNHLLSNKAQIQNMMRKVRIGDQIHLKGALVNYAKKDSKYYRTSSLTRNDTGNHACEVFFVNNFEILKKSSVVWNFLHDWSKNLFILSVLVQILIFFKKYRKESLVLKKYYKSS